jgi:hypothetical protein
MQRPVVGVIGREFAGARSEIGGMRGGCIGGKLAVPGSDGVKFGACELF